MIELTVNCKLQLLEVYDQRFMDHLYSVKECRGDSSVGETEYLLRAVEA
jgi:hypothetical protein